MFVKQIVIQMGLARTKDVLVKVGDKVREMSLPEFLQAVGFPNVTVGED